MVRKTCRKPTEDVGHYAFLFFNIAKFYIVVFKMYRDTEHCIFVNLKWIMRVISDEFENSV
jgi:hypothetical protein